MSSFLDNERAMKSESEPKRVAGRAARKRTAGAPPPEREVSRFEALLVELHGLLAAGTGKTRASSIRAALDRVARHFVASRVEISTGETGSGSAGDGRFEAGRVELPLAAASAAGAPRASLVAERPGRPWTAREREQLQLVACLVGGVLRQQRFELELRESQIWLFMALESATIGTWDWDIDSDRVRYITPFDRGAAAPEIRETVGTSWFKTTHPEDVPAARREVERALSGESDGFAFVVRARHEPYGSGNWIQMYSRGKVVDRDATGRATRIMGVHEDVTEARRREEAERARETVLAHASRLLSLSALTTSIAHEINQPLAALTSFLQAANRLLAQGEEHRSEVSAALERSVALAERASEIVRRLRRLLRREQPLSEAIEVPAVLESVREQLRREARVAGVELRARCGDAPRLLRGDRIQIEQALVNLVRNGLEAATGAERESRWVTLDAAFLGDRLQFRVSDNGPGIPETSRARLFEPFFTTKGAGSGLGLVVCQSIAELHGGHARLDHSGPDGSSFVIELPLRPEDVDAGGV
jgi:signal transduction histidine kinase